jgi:ABC-type dipeptide/oligopeptide/nickel transport system permease subunit
VARFLIRRVLLTVPVLGTMLNGGRTHLLDAPHLTIFPGVAIALLVLGFNSLGEGLRDATDPKGRLP